MYKHKHIIYVPKTPINGTCGNKINNNDNENDNDNNDCEKYLTLYIYIHSLIHEFINSQKRISQQYTIPSDEKNGYIHKHISNN